MSSVLPSGKRSIWPMMTNWRKWLERFLMKFAPCDCSALRGSASSCKTKDCWLRNLIKDYDKRLLSEGEYRGYKWVVLSNTMGYRCGYVAIPRGHPWFERDYDDLPMQCHGGLTFGYKPAKPAETFTDLPGPKKELTLPAREERVTTDGDDYWVGFDCAHAFDAADPALYFLDRVDPVVQKAFEAINKHGTIRTTEYVESECHSMIDQLILARLEIHAEKS